MAFNAVDEAVRNVVAVGADPDKIALLDNFSWGDPRRESTMGDLVGRRGRLLRSCVHVQCAVRVGQGLAQQRVRRRSDGERHAVPPTLVITAVGHVPDADRCITPDLLSTGERH